jgi:hypothetical protein
MVICLFVLIGIAAVYQMIIASGDQRFPGPAPGTPFPTSAITP